MCGYVEIFDDILVEEDEVIEVTASFEHSEPEISLIRNTASTTITDNDCEEIDSYDMLCVNIIIVKCNSVACFIVYYHYSKSCPSYTNFHADVLYAWENPEYKVVEDSQSVVVNLCLVSESGTLTFPVDISVTSTAISATGIKNILLLCLRYTATNSSVPL